ENIKKGDEYYELGTEAIFNTKDPGVNFKKAVLYYKQAQSFNPNNAELNFKIGVSYSYTNEKYRMSSHIFKAKELDPDVDPFLPYYLGVAYQLDGKFDLALDEYKKFEKNYKKADNFSK